MKQINTNLSVSESTEHLKKSLQEKGFTIFCDVDHQTNAKSADLKMPASGCSFLVTLSQAQN